MISSKNGNVKLNGTAVDVVEDFVHIIRAIRNSVTECYGEEKADLIIALCGKLAFAIDKIEDCGDDEVESMKNEMIDMLNLIKDTKEN